MSIIKTVSESSKGDLTHREFMIKSDRASRKSNKALTKTGGQPEVSSNKDISQVMSPNNTFEKSKSTKFLSLKAVLHKPK